MEQSILWCGGDWVVVDPAIQYSTLDSELLPAGGLPSFQSKHSFNLKIYNRNPLTPVIGMVLTSMSTTAIIYLTRHGLSCFRFLRL
jgi:hypothetical protein